MPKRRKNADRLRAANLRLCRLPLWRNFKGYGFRLEVSEEPPYLVQFVQIYSPAAAAGLQPFDVILGINTHDVSMTDYQQVINIIRYALDSESSLELLVVEGNAYPLLKSKKVKIDVALAVVIAAPLRMPADYRYNLKYQPRICEMSLTKSDNFFGFQVFYDPQVRILVIDDVDENTPASRALLRKNDRIIEINDKMIDKLDSKASFKKLDKARRKGIVKFSVIGVEMHQYCLANRVPLSFETVQRAVLVHQSSSANKNNDSDGDEDYQGYELPSTWERSNANQARFVVAEGSNEFRKVVIKFHHSIGPNCTHIIRIERVQNERWYMQFLAHRQEFKKRLKEDTERRLFHGCPEHVARSIVDGCFNRSFAGVNATKYGIGAYFSADAAYSHGYALPNGNGERCMFLVRVLIGRTTLGNESMKTPPGGCDSTTDKNHIFVTYHDAQAFAEYLITYK